MIHAKPFNYPQPDLRGKEKDRKGRLRDSVEVTYPVSYRYNGGTCIKPDGTWSPEGDWYPGYRVPPPIVPAGYKLVSLGVGLQLNARPPYATVLLKKVNLTQRRK